VHELFELLNHLPVTGGLPQQVISIAYNDRSNISVDFFGFAAGQVFGSVIGKRLLVKKKKSRITSASIPFDATAEQAGQLTFQPVKDRMRVGAVDIRGFFFLNFVTNIAKQANQKPA